ncbi:hypothetical protein [Wansuia hejianensis]|uniref:DUF370 domain-containing protein n=1 Tax=Wansuia hejianensis TaxID=2763667 RepID=A0A926IHN9_9FIRM|nr:hypothetical protein [Wansuia hejianensis]MBC8590877.1 hypothetical protein [Wansuia hejianensis]
MIVHIGDNISLLKKDILLMLDANTVSKSQDNKKFIENLIKNKSLVNKLDHNTKTYIIALDNSKKSQMAEYKRYKLYGSKISSSSILKRINTNGQDWGKVNG